MNQRPSQIGWWFRHGHRRFDEKHTPAIVSVEIYGRSWLEWWKGCQPDWRKDAHSDWESESCWPFSQDLEGIGDWERFLHGGKDGLFLVIISIAWWIHATGDSEDPVLDSVIADVSWVVKHLIFTLSSPSSLPLPLSPTSPLSSSSPSTPCLPRKQAKKKSAKIGPPRKHSHT